MISVDEALSKLFALVPEMGRETVPLTDAAGRVLAKDAVAQRDQPPFAASAMDGYAVLAEDAKPGATLSVIGEVAAGYAFEDAVKTGQTVRIFTGAPVPQGAQQIVLQEDVKRNNDRIELGETVSTGNWIRPAGGDFKVGETLSAPRRLIPAEVALLAAMNIAEVEVFRKPEIALLATGDELVMPGEAPSPSQIIASNTFGLRAMLQDWGANPRVLPIARDNKSSLETAFGLADDADLVVTIGGASVGDHDLVGDVAQSLGMEQSFYKVAMRPGKPLMAGRIGKAAMIGLPGNPVSSLVCGHIFILPVLRKMLGLGAAAAPRRSAQLAQPLDANGGREHYMRAKVIDGQVTVFERQDSSLLTVLADANCLCVREPHAEAVDKGATVEVVDL